MKKRILCLLLVLAMAVSLPGCGKEAKLYKEAVAALQENELKLDGSNEVSEDLLVAINNAKYEEAKNIIFMIGDGMGKNIIEAAQARYSDQLYNGTLAMNYMPFQNWQCTYSALAQVTDSAAGATALATGFKTQNRVVSMDAKQETAFKTTLELAAEKGKSTGVVATKAVTDATPAAFTAHMEDRLLQEEIAAMQMDRLLDGTLDLILGGGRSFYESEANVNKLTDVRAGGIHYTTEWDVTAKSKLPLVGLYAEERIDTADEAMPNVAEMTALALDLLSEDENGFFLMVEGSQIDSYGEMNEFDREMKELYDFDCAVAVAMRFVALHPDTVLIITADHETGDLEIPMDVNKDNVNESSYHTGEHTYKTVPVFAVGYRTEELSGIIENTDIGIFVASLLEEKEFGAVSKRSSIPGTDKKETVTIQGDGGEFRVSLGKYPEYQESVEYMRTLHMTVTNKTEKTMRLPTLQFEYFGDLYEVKPQTDYIKAGETMISSYVIPKECWGFGQLKNISEFVFTVTEGKTTLEISDMVISERAGGR